MAKFFKSLFSFFIKKKKKANLVFCGLDNSGKTTIINFLKPKKRQVDNIAPTVGYQVEKFTKHNVNFNVFDMSGQRKYREMWEGVLSDSDGIVFVIDSTDQVRMAVALNELTALLDHEDTKGKPILFFANKMDIQDALNAAEVSEKMELHELKRSFHITASNAKKGVGIEDGLQWLANEMKKMNEKGKKKIKKKKKVEKKKVEVTKKKKEEETK